MVYRQVPDLDNETKQMILRDIQLLKLARDLVQRNLGSSIQDALTHGLTCREIGEHLEVSYATVSRWSKGGTQA